ncbi:MAG: hypothetical protein IJ764_02495 [Bacteroidales bacterium]|nr:hypothetical protein [Bacteroidales bacterium]
MRKFVLVFFIFCLCGSASFAQKEHHALKKEHPKIENIVSDLSTMQKRQLNAIKEDSKKRVDELKAQQQSVRDSVQLLLSKDEDMTALLYQLFDRDAALQASISKECYATRLRIDAILTESQRAQLKQSCRAECKKK